MAWISVHEDIICKKLRKLAKEIGCSQNEALGLLVRLWLWAINNAERSGRIPSVGKEEIAEILSIGKDERYTAESIVDAMIATGWIDAKDGIYICDWEYLQEPLFKMADMKEKNVVRQKKWRENKKRVNNELSGVKVVEMEKEVSVVEPERIKPLEVIQSPEPIEATPPEPELKPEPQKVEKSYSKDFEIFWEAYPRKLGKGEAYKKYKARLNDGWSPGELLEAAQNYAAACIRKHTEKEYIKHAKTFLSEATPFRDYITTKAEESSSIYDEYNPYAEWG